MYGPYSRTNNTYYFKRRNYTKESGSVIYAHSYYTDQKYQYRQAAICYFYSKINFDSMSVYLLFCAGAWPKLICS
jgi:hypothetical protein